MGYYLAGFDVVGVDIDPQPNYPFEFHQADAIEFFLDHHEEFDAAAGSPPCQSYLNLGKVNLALGRTYDHPDLVGVTRDMFIMSGLPYIIENVEGSPLVDPVRICGTGLGRPIRRHRLFESNVPLEGIACDHKRFTEPKYWTGWSPKRPDGTRERKLSTVVQVYGNAGGTEHWPTAMGIDWMTNKEMAEAIPPSYTLHLGKQLIKHTNTKESIPA
ncbi:DNA cytosine methyltransferase [Rhodococcus hoagii]|uniref:DNA cytosine methyltransferase n=1 Tax=Rhodococcus hoagii TaxID=43767 RepID=A0A9Q4ZIK9_RHOHA|nr:DNA cytosine methyltransferase [Prescottella equi]NKT77303.1 DNA cytosine methyltransferase [Prescottella equi]NKZ81090.1 DNA cytosine methyltransferase [Prescottella equi]